MSQSTKVTVGIREVHINFVEVDPGPRHANETDDQFKKRCFELAENHAAGNENVEYSHSLDTDVWTLESDIS